METARLRSYALEQMERNGLLKRGWTFEFDNARRRFGVCRFDRKVISLSRTLVELNSEDECRDTVLHEIAHALAGPRAGHGPEWKRKCLLVGARPERCYGNGEVRLPVPRYSARCPSCGHEIGFERRPSLVRACGSCCREHARGRFDDRFELQVFDTKSGEEVGYATAAIYMGDCNSCGERYRLNRRPTSPVACARCCDTYARGKFDDRFRLRLRRIEARPDPPA